MNKVINKNVNNKHRQSGFSIIELLVAVTLGLFLMAALVEVLLSGNRSFTSANHLSRLQENGRIATGMIVTDLKRTGYMGGNSQIGDIEGSEGDVVPAITCQTGNTDWGRMVTERISGLDDTNAGYACIPNPAGFSTYLRGDVLTVRYASPWLVTVASEPNQMYLRTSMFEGKIFKGSDTADINNTVLDTPQSLHDLLSYAYFVGDSGRTCSGAAIPSLFRVRLGPAGQPLTDELLPGVEHFQVQYGVNGQYLDANNVDFDLDQVVTARIWLLIRSECAETGFTDGRTYTLGNQVYTPTPADSFRRQLYSSVVMLRN
ncbi:MAG: PilW family protein [Gammaproteobacteria bacterium]